MKMNLEQFDELIRTLDCQVYYNHTTKKDVVKTPYIVYLDEDTDNFFADNTTYALVQSYLLIIHSLKRDLELERKVMDLFTENQIPYEISDVDWDNDEYYWTTTFTFQL